MYFNASAERNLKRLEERVAKLERMLEKLVEESPPSDASSQPSESQAAA